ncbi:MAG: CYTH domain-containing protein [Spirochaetes bacterium]|nr:CYTH domain-containing protein [Spirochaetota bacterium]HOV46972.1 CYTH domain-containing protein [Exilispira sp.]MBP8991953.1 CYTH domain-containing protein [Spirochaetota bacterium]HPB47772.1 CYTH domain-containing protein [Exilispira sp.]HQM88723.1 CYTH domain-containing protein [Exilispira sp.]
MIEKELKYLLKEENYKKLYDYFSEYAEKKRYDILTTYYYDTIPYTLIPKVVFRVRDDQSTLFLSVKAEIKGRLPSENSENLQISKEFEYEILTYDTQKPDKIENIFTKFPLEEEQIKSFCKNMELIGFLEKFKKDLGIRANYLDLIGYTKTYRFSGLLNLYNIPFELDKTEYFGKGMNRCLGLDYELEVESEKTEQFESYISSLFRKLNINSNGFKRKVERLLEYLDITI